MVIRPKPERWTRLFAAIGAAALFGLCATSAHAQSEILDELLEKLKDKGVLSGDEYQALKKAREDEMAQQRAERRRQAVKQAQDAEKEQKAQEAAAKATKFDVNPGIKTMQLYGDVRLRFEARDGYSPSPSGLGVTGTNDVSRERWRYAARIGPWLLPYLWDRPVNLNRFPNGADKPGFWHKEVPSHAPEWLTRWHNDAAIPKIGIYLSVLVTLILLYSGWKGGDLVYRHGMGVRD